MTPHALRAAARCLRRGGLVLLPTEGVWGLSCDPLNPHAVWRLLSAKRRPLHKGLILTAAQTSQLAPFVADTPDGRKAFSTAEQDWPGPITWVCPARAETPYWLTGGQRGIALRVTAHPVLAALSEAFGGALVSTSANRAGRPAALRSWQARQQLGTAIEAVLPGQLTRPGRPSTIRSAFDQRILRA